MGQFAACLTLGMGLVKLRGFSLLRLVSVVYFLSPGASSVPRRAYLEVLFQFEQIVIQCMYMHTHLYTYIIHRFYFVLFKIGCSVAQAGLELIY